MAKRIGVLEVDEPQTAEPRSHVSKGEAAGRVRRLEATWVPGRRVIHMLKQVISRTAAVARSFYDETVRKRPGKHNLIPFSRQTDGSLLHYEMPCAGDIGLWRHFRKQIQVSARPDCQLAATFIGPRTRPFAFAVAPNALSQ